MTGWDEQSRDNWGESKRVYDLFVSLEQRGVDLICVIFHYFDLTDFALFP